MCDLTLWWCITPGKNKPPEAAVYGKSGIIWGKKINKKSRLHYDCFMSLSFYIFQIRLEMVHVSNLLCMCSYDNTDTSASTEWIKFWEACRWEVGLILSLKKPSRISLSLGLTLSVLQPVSSVFRFPGAGEALIQAEDVRGQDARKSNNEWRDTRHICGTSSGSAFCWTLSQHPLSQLPAWKWLAPKTSLSQNCVKL